MDPRVYFAVVLQMGGIILILLESLAYAISAALLGNMWVGIVLGLIGFAMAVCTVIAGHWNGLSLHQLLPGERERSGNFDGYASSVAMIDLVLLTMLVLLTGGVTRSSFVSLLLLVPVLTIMVRPSGMRRVIGGSIIAFVVLVVARLPVTVGWPLKAGVIGFDLAGVPIAYEIASVLNLCASVWATFLQYRAVEIERGRRKTG